MKITWNFEETEGRKLPEKPKRRWEVINQHGNKAVGSTIMESGFYVFRAAIRGFSLLQILQTHL
jgi:hypothetical protein